MQWHATPITKLAVSLKTNLKTGLTSKEARTRLKRSGSNTLPKGKHTSLVSIFLQQFKNSFIYILLCAAFVALLLGEQSDAFFILVVLFLNATVGTIQEGRAQKTFDALQNLVVTKSTVLRDGKDIIIPDSQLVPGDILVISEGEKIGADARIFQAYSLRVDESILTGESLPVEKTNSIFHDKALAISEQKNMLFRATLIVGGNAKAIVVQTGINSEIGKIGSTLNQIESPIPLKKELAIFSKRIIVSVVIGGAVLFCYGILRGYHPTELVLTILSLSISVIPEGLPVVLTIVLATGMWRMAKRNALVKQLQAVESLGQADIIALDKTGTITQNQLVVRALFTNGTSYDVTGDGYNPIGEILDHKTQRRAKRNHSLTLLLTLAAISAQAKVAFQEQEKRWITSGDPTEAALLVAAHKAGITKEHIDATNPLIEEIPFDYRSRFRATLHPWIKGHIIIISGAPEIILSKCVTYHLNKKAASLTTQYSKIIGQNIHESISKGLRVIGLAYKILPVSQEKTLKNISLDDCTFLGFEAMQDSLRPEIPQTLKQIQSLGLKIVMITGDHALTAMAIAKQAGIFQKADKVLAGKDLIEMSPDTLSRILPAVSVFARVTPEDKMRIIQAYQRIGKIIAMTGDGVNDAPALLAADLGISMGTASEVSKEAADVILLDDNIASMTHAVQEGRAMYATIRKVTLYLVSTSLGEVLTITGALLLGFPLPILAAQIIWLNLVTDGFLDIALGMEQPKPDGDFYEKQKDHHIITHAMLGRIAIMAPVMMIGTLVIFAYTFPQNLPKALTLSLTTLAIFQWFNAWNCRSSQRSLLSLNPLSNPYLVGATGIVIALQLLAVYTPFMQKLLHTVPLSLNDWLIAIGVSSNIIIVEEVRKYFYRNYRKRKTI